MGKHKTDTTGKPKVDPALDGFDIKIDSFGEIKSNFDITIINKFLDQRVDDKKLRDRKDNGKDNEVKTSDDPKSSESQ